VKGCQEFVTVRKCLSVTPNIHTLQGIDDVVCESQIRCEVERGGGGVKRDLERNRHGIS
jgi:hypothetical protein